MLPPPSSITTSRIGSSQLARSTCSPEQPVDVTLRIHRRAIRGHDDGVVAIPSRGGPDAHAMTRSSFGIGRQTQQVSPVDQRNPSRLPECALAQLAPVLLKRQ